LELVDHHQVVGALHVPRRCPLLEPAARRRGGRPDR
jgi:hypothetical protein